MQYLSPIATSDMIRFLNSSHCRNLFSSTENKSFLNWKDGLVNISPNLPKMYMLPLAKSNFMNNDKNELLPDITTVAVPELILLLAFNIWGNSILYGLSKQSVWVTPSSPQFPDPHWYKLP